MNSTVEKLAYYVEQGDVATIEQLRQGMGVPDRSDIARRAELRHVERAMVGAVARGRELGIIARPGVDAFDNGKAKLSDLGVSRDAMRSLPRIGPGAMTDEEFAEGLARGIAEGNPGRDNIVRHVKAMRAGVTVESLIQRDRPADLARTRRVNPYRVIAQTVDTLRGVCGGLELLESEDYDALSIDDVREWSREIDACKRVINQMAKELASRG